MDTSRNRIKNFLKVFPLAASLVLLGSCGTMNTMSHTARGGVIGGSSGAVLGTAIGGLAGHGKGAAIGAAVGTAVGAGVGVLVGKQKDAVNRKMALAAEQSRQVSGAKVEQVTDTVSGLETVRVTFDSGILFVTGKSDLSNTAKYSLSQFANNVLLPNAGMDVIIRGYTDNQGWHGCTAAESERKNEELSQLRAQNVSSYLLSCGVPSNRIREVKGWGEANPVADNSTVTGREQNRRVEVYLYASEEMIRQAKEEGEAVNLDIN